MSVIMAIRDSGRVWMAADTQVSCEELKFHTVSEGCLQKGMVCAFQKTN